MSLSKLINSGISYIGKNHASIDKLAGIAKTKKFDIKTIGDAALFLPFGWQVKGIIWVGTRVYATYAMTEKKAEDFEDIRGSQDVSISIVNNFLTEAVMTNVHSSKFEVSDIGVNATHTRDLAEEMWDQTTITGDFVSDFTQTIFNRIYVTAGQQFDLSESHTKDLKLKIGGLNSVTKDVIVRVTYEVSSENEYTLLMRTYVVEEGEIKKGHADLNLELDQADVEELIAVLETKKDKDSVLEALLNEAKGSLDNIQKHVQNSYVFVKDKTQDLVLVATLKGVILYPQVKEKVVEIADKVVEISDEVGDTLSKTYNSLSSFIKGKFQSTETSENETHTTAETEASSEETKDNSEKWENREFGASEKHVEAVVVNLDKNDSQENSVDEPKKPE